MVERRYTKAEVVHFYEYVLSQRHLSMRITNRPKVGLWRIDALESDSGRRVAGWDLMDTRRGVRFEEAYPDSNQNPAAFCLAMLRIILKYNVVLCIENRTLKEQEAFRELTTVFSEEWHKYNHQVGVLAVPSHSHARASEPLLPTSNAQSFPARSMIRHTEPHPIDEARRPAGAEPRIAATAVAGPAAPSLVSGVGDEFSAVNGKLSTLEDSLRDIRTIVREHSDDAAIKERVVSLETQLHALQGKLDNMAVSPPSSPSPAPAFAEAAVPVLPSPPLTPTPVAEPPSDRPPSESPPSPYKATMHPIIFMMPQDAPPSAAPAPAAPAAPAAPGVAVCPPPTVAAPFAMPNIIINNHTSSTKGDARRAQDDDQAAAAEPRDARVEGDNSGPPTAPPQHAAPEGDALSGADAAARASEMNRDPAIQTQNRSEEVINRRVVSMLRQFHKGLNSFILDST